MSPKQRRYRNSLLRRIHCHPLYKSLLEASAWEDWLYVRFGVTSSSILSLKELWIVLDVFDGKIEDKKALKPDSVGRMLIASKDGGLSFKQYEAIKHLWEQKARDKSERALLYFVKRTVGVLYLNLYHIKKEEATMVLIALAKVR